jgi:hypothetical protein
MADPALRAPVADTFSWLRTRLAGVLAEARAAGELTADPDTTAATVIAVLQGGYVLARAAGDPAPFADAVDGLLALLGRTD